MPSVISKFCGWIFGNFASTSRRFSFPPFWWIGKRNLFLQHSFCSVFVMVPAALSESVYLSSSLLCMFVWLYMHTCCWPSLEHYSHEIIGEFSTNMRELSRGPGIHNQYEVSAQWPSIFFMVLCKYQIVSGFSYFKVSHMLCVCHMCSSGFAQS